MLAAAKPNKFITLNRKDLRKMENENINTNATDTQMNSTNESKSESFANEALTANTNYGTISSADIENGTAELVLIPPFEGDDGGVSVACVEGDSCSCDVKSKNAITLILDQWTNGSITDTVSERWYSFCISEDAIYTIYTKGDTNTTGRLYDHTGNLITINDDRAGNLNFRIVYPLCAEYVDNEPCPYYVKVTTPQTETGEFQIRVIKRVLVSQVTVSDANIALDIGETHTLSASVYPDNADNKDIVFSSNNTTVATVDATSGKITALSPGIAVISAQDADQTGTIGECEVWVRGKTPVFLLHGRIDNTYFAWGALNSLCTKYDDNTNNNDHYSSGEDCAMDEVTRYIDVNSQKILDISENETNLARNLEQNGYEKNVNLFAFNYPNEDSVIYSAKKFKRYIENLIADVRTNGSDKIKTSFYPSRNDYSINNYKINIVGHSMGGLVARYYIENLGYDNHVAKLITVCTPHWGTGSADLSNTFGWIGDRHKLCDHDLSPGSAMYGRDDSLKINSCLLGCPSNYELTDELNYSREPSTKYYAIAGIDYNADEISDSNFLVENLEVCTTYSELENIIQTESIKEYGVRMFKTIPFVNEDAVVRFITVDLESKEVEDNIVGFLSQIGWTGDNIFESGNVYAPNKKIPMERISVNIDTNGGNSFQSNLHSKMPHRQCVIDQIINYLDE